MTDFPMDTAIFNKIVEVFNQTRSYILLLFPLAFFIRIAFGFIILKGDSFIDILKDSLFLFLGLFFFTDILKLTLQIPYFVASELSFGEWRNINFGEGIFIKPLKRLVDWIGILSYWISFGLYVVIVSILGFFAGYILFLGTMFRAYGILKVFFILLFVVSLWPLLWHSINFAVFTIAVSDNAFANNVIVGGASLAKVFIPVWLISKTSKSPVSSVLKKVSSTGGNLASAYGNYAVHLTKEELKDSSEENQNKQELEAEGTKLDIQESFVQEGQGAFLGNEPEDFSMRKSKTVLLPEGIKPIEDISKEDPLTLNNQKHQENKSLEVSSQNHVENNMETNVLETHSTDSKQEVHIESNPQITKEIKETQNISQNQNQSVLNESQSQSVEHEVTTTETKPDKQTFNESIHREDWIEEREDTRPHHKPTEEQESEL